MERQKTREWELPIVSSRNSGDPVMMASRFEDCFSTSQARCYESISYQTGPTKKAFRPCSFHRFTVDDNPHPIVGQSPSIGLRVDRGADGRYSCSIVGGDPSLDDVMYFGGPRRFVKTYAPSENDVAEALNDTQVRLASLPTSVGMNIPRAIIELKDVPRTVRSIRKIASLLRPLPRNLKKVGSMLKGAPKQYRRALESWRETPLGNICEAYLAVVFGIKPTTADIRKMIDEVAPQDIRVSVRKDQKSFTAGETVRALRTVTSRESWAKSASTSFHGTRAFNWQFPWVPAGGSTVVYRTFTDLTGLNATGVSEDPTANAWPVAACTHVVDERYRLTSFGRVAKDVLNFEQPPPLIAGADPTDTAWELIPFSFVVDWFADLGKWLRQENRLAIARRGGFYLDPATGVWLGERVDRSTWVPQLEAAFNVSVRINGDPVDSGVRYVPVILDWNAKRTVTYVRQTIERGYNRRRVRDRVDFARLNTRGFGDQGPFQWVTGTALAVQNCEALKRIGSILF